LLKRYAAFLRGVSPMNCRMPELKAAFEAAGFADVRTLLSSGNVVFSARPQAAAALEKKAQAAMKKTLGQEFFTIVRAIEDLEVILASDPYRGARLASAAKRVVTFLREPPEAAPKLPQEQEGARVLRLDGSHLFSAYVASDEGPVFMKLIEKAVGKEQTTRTWQTVEKVVKAGAASPGR
jgi:uncharacterized protein (DUF1697 family)